MRIHIIFLYLVHVKGHWLEFASKPLSWHFSYLLQCPTSSLLLAADCCYSIMASCHAGSNQVSVTETCESIVMVTDPGVGLRPLCNDWTNRATAMVLSAVDGDYLSCIGSEVKLELDLKHATIGKISKLLSFYNEYLSATYVVVNKALTHSQSLSCSYSHCLQGAFSLCSKFWGSEDFQKQETSVIYYILVVECVLLSRRPYSSHSKSTTAFYCTLLCVQNQSEQSSTSCIIIC